MTKLEALSKFGLSLNATEEEIKKAYRSLVKKYHPDQFIEGSLEQKQAEEKMKEINEAKETLDKIFKKGEEIPYHQKSNSYQQTSIDIEKYKRKMVEKLSQYNSSNCPVVDLMKYHNEIAFIIFKFENKIKNYIEKKEIDNAYYNYKLSIKDIFQKFKYDFFKKYDIDEAKITGNINYECNLEEFYNQLLNIKEKYDLKKLYRKKIEQDLSDYKLRAGYDYLKELVEIGIDNILKRLKLTNYTNYEEELNKGKKEIDEVFEDYFKYLSQFNEIQKFFEGENLENAKIAEIYSLFKRAWNSFNNHASLYDTEENLKKLNSLIEKYKEYQQYLKKIVGIDVYVKVVIDKYNKFLSKLTYPNDLEKAKLATITLNKIFEIVEQVKNQTINIENISLLQKIKFEFFDEDEKILNKIGRLDDSKGIYILNRDTFNYSEIIIGTIVDYSQDYIVIQGIDKFSEHYRSDKISIEKFKQSYMPLNLWLSNSKFCGKNSAIFIGEVILYYNDNLSINYDRTTNKIKIHSSFDTTDIYNPDMEKFKNISYMIDKIEETLQKAIQISEEKMKKRGKIR